MIKKPLTAREDGCCVAVVENRSFYRRHMRNEHDGAGHHLVIHDEKNNTKDEMCGNTVLLLMMMINKLRFTVEYVAISITSKELNGSVTNDLISFCT